MLLCLYVAIVTGEEYQLLVRLNQMTMVKYSDMTALSARLNVVSDRLNEKCESDNAIPTWSVSMWPINPLTPISIIYFSSLFYLLFPQKVDLSPLF